MNQERTKNVSTNNMYDQKNNYYYCKPLKLIFKSLQNRVLKQESKTFGSGVLKTKKTSKSPLHEGWF